jgi:hypothetical protein
MIQLLGSLPAITSHSAVKRISRGKERRRSELNAGLCAPCTVRIGGLAIIVGLNPVPKRSSGIELRE